MPATQMQDHCAECGRPTLHTRQIEHPNHLIHFLLTFFLCGLWLPIWILLALFPEKHPWHCTQCGHQPGQPTSHDLERRARQKQIRAEELAEIRAEQRERRAEQMARLRESSAVAMDATKAGAAAVLRQVWGVVVASLRAADRVLEKMATGDNFTHWFFRILFGTLGLLMLVGVLAVAWRTVFG